MKSEISEGLSGVATIELDTNERPSAVVELPVLRAPVLKLPPALALPLEKAPERPRLPSTIVMFSFEAPESLTGAYIRELAKALAITGSQVHIIARRAFEVDAEAVSSHAVGECGRDLLEQVLEFNLGACGAFLSAFTSDPKDVLLMGFEWSSVGAIKTLLQKTSLRAVHSIHSFERQRADMSSELSRRIEEFEIQALTQSEFVLVHDKFSEALAGDLSPERKDCVVEAFHGFPFWEFESRLDAGGVKARFQVGPVDPTILFVGPLEPDFGPDILMRSIPAILKNTPQARFVFVGDGSLYWPLRVHARYLLLEHAVRMPGHFSGPALNELICAADIVCVPSCEKVNEGVLTAAWAARKPVVASHNLAKSLIEHEQDGILIYPNESSCVWGIERLLFDPALGKAIGAAGRKKLECREGWESAAAQFEEAFVSRAKP